MLSFRIHEMEALSGPYSSWFDKSHLLKGKTSNWKKMILKQQDLEWFQIHRSEEVLILVEMLY